MLVTELLLHSGVCRAHTPIQLAFWEPEMGFQEEKHWPDPAGEPGVQWDGGHLRRASFKGDAPKVTVTLLPLFVIDKTYKWQSFQSLPNN